MSNSDEKDINFNEIVEEVTIPPLETINKRAAAKQKNMEDLLKEELKREIKILLVNENITLTEVVRRVNEMFIRMDAVQNLHNKISKGTLRYIEAQQIAEVLGYEIKWIKK
jgi:hypothetical protein